jgi:hypothetical protein
MCRRLLILVVNLLCLVAQADAQAVRLPLPAGLSAMSRPYRTASGVILVSPTSIWTSTALTSRFTRQVIDPTQRELDVVRVAADTVDVAVTTGGRMAPRRAVYRSTNGGQSWLELEPLPSGAGKVLASNGVVTIFQAPALVTDTAHAVYAVDCSYRSIERYVTSIPLLIPIGGHASRDTIWLSGEAKTVANTTWALGGVSSCLITAWSPRPVPALRRVFVDDATVVRQIADTLYVEHEERREQWSVPVTQGFAVEPEDLIVLPSGPVMSFRGRLWRYTAATDRWSIMLSVADITDHLGLYRLADTMIAHVSGLYPWASTNDGTTDLLPMLP